MKPRLLSDSELNTIRGKVLAGHATRDEMLAVFGHLDLIESALENEDENEFYDLTWRERFGIPE